MLGAEWRYFRVKIMGKSAYNQDQLVGKCPVCAWPEESIGHNDAYSGRTLVDSDKDWYLVWSNYYEQYVCRFCEVRGRDILKDEAKLDYDEHLERERQRMGFVRNYTKNPDI